MKTLKKVILLFVLFLIYIYIISIDNIPNEIVIFKGENININTLWGISIKNGEKIVETSTQVEENSSLETQTLEVSIFDKITVKKIDVNILEETEIIPIGETVGIKLYTKGALVVGTAAIENENGEKVKPFKDTEIKEGDSIIKINEKVITNSQELIEIINNSNGEKLQITYVSKEKENTCEIMPVKDKTGKYKIGLWVRDSAGGLGTITFYNEKDQSFAGLGHAITDIDTGDIINSASGEIDDVNIISIIKGEKEEPGKIQGTINNKMIGNIYKNTEYGIYGKVKNIDNLKIDYTRKMKIASRNEIKLGEAITLCEIDGQVKEYKINIQKIYLNNNYDNKCMIIKINDKDLINKTGGIIQGMSGSPIIQNGKFIGAITHVFVNDPTLGYAVFGDTMIKQMKTL